MRGNSLRLLRSFKGKLRLINEDILIFLQFYRNKCNVNRIKKKKNIKVLFIAFQSSIWKYEGIYKLMRNHNRFNPIILISPIFRNGKIYTENMNAMGAFLDNKGYPYLKAFDEKNLHWINIRKEIDPDVIFYTEPFFDIMKKEYRITNFLDKLICYTDYSAFVEDERWCYDMYYHNLFWQFFYPSDMLYKQLALKSRNKGYNVFVSGSLGNEPILDNSNSPSDPWKIKNKTIKRIIWAPHHTISDDGPLYYSTFLYRYQYMLQLAEIYKGQIQIAFKPHPILKQKLYELKDWGKEKTDDYYAKWNSNKNTQLEEGDYVDLFKTSDALIHDCSAFIIEYLCTRKPVMYLAKDNNADKLNNFAKLAYKQHYIGKSDKDIEAFIHKIVLKGEDEMKFGRDLFFDNYLTNRNGLTASENAFQRISQLLDNE
jgi:hypothetical protein